MRRNKNIWMGIVAALIAVTLMAGGCREIPPPQTEISLDPFTSVWGLGEKQVVTFSGSSAGHGAGEQSDFVLKLDNRVADEPWQGEYCVFLIDQTGTTLPVAHEKFSIPAGLETQQVISVQLDNLEGPYGLSLLIPGRGQSITTIWIGEKKPVSAGPWPVFHTCPYYLTEEGSQQLAEDFVRNSPTFVFDGIEDSLQLVNTEGLVVEHESDSTEKLSQMRGWVFTFHFESAHAEYGDWTGQMLAEVITPHEAIITVEQGEIKTAVMDDKWDMINRRMLDEVEISLAPIHEVDVLFMESFPVQVGVHIQGGLRDGCTSFRDAVVTRKDNIINIEATTQRPKDVICTQVYSFFEENLNLGSDFTVGTTYTLNVNDYTTTFEMPR